MLLSQSARASQSTNHTVIPTTESRQTNTTDAQFNNYM